MWKLIGGLLALPALLVLSVLMIFLSSEDLSLIHIWPALRRLGMITPWAPAHSAVRMMAPRLSLIHI